MISLLVIRLWGRVRVMISLLVIRLWGACYNDIITGHSIMGGVLE